MLMAAGWGSEDSQREGEALISRSTTLSFPRSSQEGFRSSSSSSLRKRHNYTCVPLARSLKIPVS